MSEFASFPNLHSDESEVFAVAEWSLEKLDYKTNEYGAFLQRKDPMPRAIAAANKILDLLLFEQGYRDGIYKIYTVGKIEDEVCDGAA